MRQAHTLGERVEQEHRTDGEVVVVVVVVVVSERTGVVEVGGRVLGRRTEDGKHCSIKQDSSPHSHGEFGSDPQACIIDFPFRGTIFFLMGVWGECKDR